ncbi:MAG: glycine--tRNA ligase subunit beta [Candidatus Margulisbacteria bacterium]|nr:glycine--tRNA ligase subunit beta [Candidatus Margulisiibacteriota bacterium]
MLNALLEIGCEEIPARFMPGFLDDLKKKAEEKLIRERLSFGSVQTFGTYRRLTLYIENLGAKQPDIVEENRGPAAEIAFDPSGVPRPAAVGFAKGQGIAVSDLFIQPVNGKNYVFAKITRKGQTAEKVLKTLFPEIITSLHLPLAMRWGDLDFKFIRPIHSILAMCGGRAVKFELAGVKASKIKVPKADLKLYKRLLEKAGIIVDQNERKELVKKAVQKAAKKAGAKALIDEDLLNEVVYLVEYPKAYAGRFKEEFLGIPGDVLITSMKKHQKYFPLVDSEGRLTARFVVVTDGCWNPAVVEGNQKVLSARLSDAKFFFDEDLKQPLKIRVADLDKVAYFEKLGTMAHKVERIVKLSEWIGKHLGLSSGEQMITRRIAELCKADLTCKMVYEFPELQGVMGREYALRSNEDPKVAKGIYEHYLPRFADDQLPSSLPGMVVALADRVDSIVGCFSTGTIPSGSEDPYGLRRAMNGIVRIILEKKLDLLLDELLAESHKLYEPVFLGFLFAKGETGYKDYPKIEKQITEFAAARVKPFLLDKGIRYDVVDAVIANCNDIRDTVVKAETLNKLTAENWLAGVIASADRIARIAKDVPRENIVEADLADKEEKELFEIYLKVNWEVGEAVKKEEWAKAVFALSALTGPLEIFFDKVLVMHKDERLRMNRLSLLKNIGKLYLQLADFTKIAPA